MFCGVTGVSARAVWGEWVAGERRVGRWWYLWLLCTHIHVHIHVKELLQQTEALTNRVVGDLGNCVVSLPAACVNHGQDAPSVTRDPKKTHGGTLRKTPATEMWTEMWWAVREHAPVVARRVLLQIYFVLLLDCESNVRRRRLARQVQHLVQTRQRLHRAGLHASDARHLFVCDLLSSAGLPDWYPKSDSWLNRPIRRQRSVTKLIRNPLLTKVL